MSRRFIKLPKSVTASSNLSLVDEFLKYHEDSHNYSNNPDGFAKMYEILDTYGNDSEDVDVVFRRASESDQRKMVNLIRPKVTASTSTSKLYKSAQSIADDISEFLDATTRIDDIKDYLDDADIEAISNAMDALYEFAHMYSHAEGV